MNQCRNETHVSRRLSFEEVRTGSGSDRVRDATEELPMKWALLVRLT